MSRPHGAAAEEPGGATLMVPAEEVTVLVTDGSSFGAAERGLWHHYNIGASLPRRLWREKDAIAIVSAEGRVDAEAAAAVLSSRRKKRRGGDGDGEGGGEAGGALLGASGVGGPGASEALGSHHLLRMTSESLSSRATFQVTAATQANYLYARYRFALVIDVSPSMFALDVHSCRLPFHDVLPAVQTWLTALAAPMSTARLAEAAAASGAAAAAVPLGLLERVTYRPEVHVTVLAQYRGRHGHCATSAPPARMLLHGGLLTADTLDDTVQRLARALLVVEDEFRQLIEAESTGALPSSAPAGDEAPSPPSLGPAIEAATRALSMLPADACPAVVLVSDCVSSAPLELDYGNLLMQLVRHDTTLHVIQLGTCSGVHATLGSVPDVDDAQLLAVGTGGVRIRARDLKLFVEPPVPQEEEEAPTPLLLPSSTAQVASVKATPPQTLLSALAPALPAPAHAGTLKASDREASTLPVAASSSGSAGMVAGPSSRPAGDAALSPSRYADALCTALAAKAGAAGDEAVRRPVVLKAGSQLLHARPLSPGDATLPEAGGAAAAVEGAAYHRLFKPSSIPLGGALSVELWALATATADSSSSEGDAAALPCAVVAAAPSRHPHFSVRCLTPLQRFMLIRSSTTPPPSMEGTSSSSQMLAKARGGKAGAASARSGGAAAGPGGALASTSAGAAAGAGAASSALFPVPSGVGAPLYRVLSRADFLFPWAGPPPPIPYLRLTLAQTRFKLAGGRGSSGGSSGSKAGRPDPGGMDAGLLIGLRLHEGFHIVSGGPAVGNVGDAAGRLGPVDPASLLGVPPTPVPAPELYAGGTGGASKTAAGMAAPRVSLPALPGTPLAAPGAPGGAGEDAALLASDAVSGAPTVLVLQWQPHIMIEYVVSVVQRKWVKSAGSGRGAKAGKRGAAGGAGAGAAAVKPLGLRSRGAGAAATAAAASAAIASERYLQVTMTLIGRQDFVRLYAASVSEGAGGATSGAVAGGGGAGGAGNAGGEASNRLLHRLPPGSVELRRVKALGNVLRVLQQADQVLSHLCAPAQPPSVALTAGTASVAEGRQAATAALAPRDPAEVGVFLRFFAQFGSLSQALWHRWFDVEQLEVAVALDGCLFPSTRTTLLAAERVLVDTWADAALPVLHNGAHGRQDDAESDSSSRTFIRFVHPVLRGQQEGGGEGSEEALTAVEAAATGINEPAAASSESSDAAGAGQRMLPFVLARVTPVGPTEPAAAGAPKTVSLRTRARLVHVQLAFFGCAPPQRAAELQRLVTAMCGAPHPLAAAAAGGGNVATPRTYTLQVLPAPVHRLLLQPASKTSHSHHRHGYGGESGAADVGEICCGFLDLPQRFLRAVLWQRRWQYRLACPPSETSAAPLQLQQAVLALLEAGVTGAAAVQGGSGAALQEWTLLRAIDEGSSAGSGPRAYRHFGRQVAVALQGEAAGFGSSSGGPPPRLCLAQCSYAVACEADASGKSWEVVVDGCFAMEPVEGHVAAVAGRAEVAAAQAGEGAALRVTGCSSAGSRSGQPSFISTRALFTGFCKALHASAYRALLTAAAAGGAGAATATATPFRLTLHTVDALNHAFCLPSSSGATQRPATALPADTLVSVVDAVFCLQQPAAAQPAAVTLNETPALVAGAGDAGAAAVEPLTPVTAEEAAPSGSQPTVEPLASTPPPPAAPSLLCLRITSEPPPPAFGRRQPLAAASPLGAAFAHEMLWRPAGVAACTSSEVVTLPPAVPVA